MFEGENVKEYPFTFEGGLDQVGSYLRISPGKLIACDGVEIRGNQKGYYRPSGYERCTSDTLPSAVTVIYWKIDGITGGSLVVDTEYTCAATGSKVKFLALGYAGRLEMTTDLEMTADLEMTESTGEIGVFATYDSSFSADDTFTDGTVSFDLDEQVSAAAHYTASQIQGFLVQAIEQTRDAIPVVTGSGNVEGIFRLDGSVYAFRGGALYKGTDYTWTAIPMPQVMYFDNGVVEIAVGDMLTNGTALGVVASVTRQTGSWNYSVAESSQSAGYVTFDDVHGTFSADDYLVKSGTELVTNGFFQMSTGWTASDDCWDITGGVASCDGTQTGTETLSQDISAVANSNYITILVVENYSAGNVNLNLGGDNDGTVRSANGVYLESIRCGTDSSIYVEADSDFDGDVAVVSAVLSKNMVENFEFDSDRAWTKGTGWTIGSGVASKAAGTGSDLSQDIYATSADHIVIYTISGMTAGALQPKIGTATGTSRTANGTYRDEITADDTTLYFSADASFDGDLEVVTVALASELGQTTTDDIVRNGSFETDTLWTKGTSWTINTGTEKAVCGGAQTEDSDITQPFLLATGRAIAITFTVSGYSAGNVTALLGTDEGTDVSADGTYTQVIAPTADATVIGLRADSDFDGNIDSISIADAGDATVYSANTAYTLNSGGRYGFVKYNPTVIANNDSIFGWDGANDAFQFDGTTYVPIFHPDSTDYPSHGLIHQDRLYLAFPGGEWPYSVSGSLRRFDPLLGAGTWSVGAEITGNVLIQGNAAAVFTADSFWILTGDGTYTEESATREWSFYEHDGKVGGEEWSMAGKSDYIFFDGGDLYSIKTTDSFGDFSANPLLNEIKPFLDAHKGTVVAAIYVKAKSQYRLFFSDGRAAYISFERGKISGATTVKIPVGVNCAYVYYEDGEEYIYFGTDDGYVYLMDSGNTYDDAAITGSLRTAFYHYGNPRRLDQFLQMILELDGPVLLTDNTSITYTVNYSHGSTESPRPIPETISDIDQSGGFYGTNDGYGNFVWSGPVVSEIVAYLDGYGYNMSILITFSSRYDSDFGFLSAIVDYIPLGLANR